MQFWPAAQNAPETQVSAAHAISASRHTMTGELEPSSMPIFLRPALATMRSPASTPPVKLTIRTRGSETKASPSTAP